MRIGYACKAIGVKDTASKSCLLKNASHETLTALIRHNLTSLKNMLDYTHQNEIKMLRITSDLIPFATSAGENLCWEALFAPELHALQKLIAQNDIRVSMHPGQYTVINSPNEGVVKRAIADLEYHARVLDALAPQADNKIILHVGGVYNDKPAATDRFVETYNGLSEKVKRRLVLENDDRCYTAQEVLALCQRLHAPAVFDNLHNQLNPSEKNLDESEWIREFAATWGEKDGRQKIHYSQQARGKRPGSHSQTIDYRLFLDFCKALNGQDVDIMLEVKDKNLSALKCIHCLQYPTSLPRMEKEWARYKYLILEHAPEQYHAIRANFHQKEQPIALLFYDKLGKALDSAVEVGHSHNALNHVWGYFKECATPAEKQQWEKRINAYLNGNAKLEGTKKYLWKMAVKYQQEYLLQSHYFFIE